VLPQLLASGGELIRQWTRLDTKYPLECGNRASASNYVSMPQAGVWSAEAVLPPPIMSRCPRQQVAQDKSCVTSRTHLCQPHSGIRALFVDGLALHAQGSQGGHGQHGEMIQTDGGWSKALADVRQGVFSSDKFCKFIRRRRAFDEADRGGRAMEEGISAPAGTQT